MWVNGPFPCGAWPDLKIALSDLVHCFVGDERAVADNGCKGHPEFFDASWKHHGAGMIKMWRKMSLEVCTCLPPGSIGPGGIRGRLGGRFAGGSSVSVHGVLKVVKPKMLIFRFAEQVKQCELLRELIVDGVVGRISCAP